MWAEGTLQAEMIPVIAKEAGMDEAATAETMATFIFPSIQEQLGPKWLGGGAQAFMAGVAEIFVSNGDIPSALPAYDQAVNAAPLAAAAEM